MLRSRDADWTGFRGVCRSLDAGSLPPWMAPDVLNVEIHESFIRKRRGKSAYNSSAPTANPVLGAWVYRTGAGAQTPVMAASTNVYADINGNGSFGDAGDTIASGLTAGASRMEFVQWKDVLYFGDGVNTLRKWSGSGTSAVVANLAAPAAAPDVEIYNVTAEACDSGTWTLSGADITTSYYTAGSGTVLQFDATAAGAVGSYIHKTFSAGATLDLSKAERLAFLMYPAAAGDTIQIGVKDNSGTIYWSDHIKIATADALKWTRYDVPLSRIPQADRTASTGMAIRWIAKESTSAYTRTLYFENFELDGPLEADTYKVYYTYYNSTTGQESGPSAAATIALESSLAQLGISVGVTSTATADKVRVYRYRLNGPFTKPKRVAEEADTVGTIYDTKADGILAEENAASIVASVADPPIAKAYAVANRRLLAGYATVSSVTYPWRIYLSRKDFPEMFSTLQTLEFVDDDPGVAGYIDIPTHDSIVRILEVDDTAIIFCRSSIWTLRGSNWPLEGATDVFSLQKRASVGLAAPNAVAVSDRAVYFQSYDGIRVLFPSSTFEGEFLCWVISEPVVDYAIPRSDSQYLSAGVDQDNRVHFVAGQSSGTSLVFDPQIQGALTREMNLARPGWTIYQSWAFSCLAQRRPEPKGALLGGDLSTGKLWWLQQDTSADLEDDAGSNIAWSWTSPADATRSSSDARWRSRCSW